MSISKSHVVCESDLPFTNKHQSQLFGVSNEDLNSIKHPDTSQGFVHYYALYTYTNLRDIDSNIFGSYIHITQTGGSPEQGNEEEVAAPLKLEGTEDYLEVRASAPTR